MSLRPSLWSPTPYGDAMNDAQNGHSPGSTADGGTSSGEIWLLRHGETPWSRAGKHTGRTDIDLDEEGVAQARALRSALTGVSFDEVRVSPLIRATRTAVESGILDDGAGKRGGNEGDIEDVVDSDLIEWDYGRWEGRTTAEIRAELAQPLWTIFSAPIPGGEQAEDVEMRARRVLHRVERTVRSGGRVAFIAHGHVLRILTAAWLNRPAADAGLWALSPATISVLGYEHEQHVIRRWNCGVPIDGHSTRA